MPRIPSPNNEDNPLLSWCHKEWIMLLFYAGLLLVTLASGVATFANFPITTLPWNGNNVDWSNAWLLASMIDATGVRLCFSGVVLSSEDSWWTGIAWTVGCLLLGSPMCCLWVFLWLTKQEGSLRLERPTDSDMGCSSTQHCCSKDLSSTGAGGVRRTVVDLEKQYHQSNQTVTSLA